MYSGKIFRMALPEAFVVTVKLDTLLYKPVLMAVLDGYLQDANSGAKIDIKH